ncbi:MAG: hypothetical protein M5U01_17610 [Ardenticatenaceae bacterium]|nr:hypothetical protein [Ardenticatenaceae bacterium]HBY93935.1 hypothetical protein [Chloroflexota bacterium]
MDPQQHKIHLSDKAVAIYHVVYSREGFEETAQTLFKLVQEAQRLHPGRKRILFLDIEGHRNKSGGFDADMVELQSEFLLGFLGRFLSEIHTPLVQATNPKEQENDLPPALIVQDAG